jgi:hypothetical protein
VKAVFGLVHEQESVTPRGGNRIATRWPRPASLALAPGSESGLLAPRFGVIARHRPMTGRVSARRMPDEREHRAQPRVNRTQARWRLHAMRKKRKKVVEDPAPSRHSSRHGGIMLPSLELRASTGVSTEFSSAELLAGSGFARVDSIFGTASDVTLMNRPLRVLSKVTDKPYMRNCGPARRSSLPSLLHVFGQLADAAFFLPTIFVEAICRSAAVPAHCFATGRPNAAMLAPRANLQASRWPHPASCRCTRS